MSRYLGVSDPCGERMSAPQSLTPADIFLLAFGGVRGVFGRILREAYDIRKEHPEWSDQEAAKTALGRLEKGGLQCDQEVALLEALFPGALDRKTFVIDSAPLRERIQRVLAREVAKKI